MQYDTIVIGAGVMGTATAYHLAKRGQKVLLLEQFSFLHGRGSSHGKSRIIRLTYAEPQFERLMPHAYRLWSEAEDELGRKVFVQTGGLDFGRPDNEDLKGSLCCGAASIFFVPLPQTVFTSEPFLLVSGVIANVKKWNTPHEILSGAEIRKRWPAFARVPDSYVGLYQANTGILDATNSVELFLNLARKYGATTKDLCKVVGFQSGEDSAGARSVRVTTEDGTQYTARHAVIAVGAWLAPFLAPHRVALPQHDVWKISFGYYKVKDSQKVKDFGVGRFPVFIHYDEYGFYGFPSFEMDGYLKVSCGGRADAVM